jgi:hypothetical protein
MRCCIARMSPPAQKALPAPVSTSARTLSSRFTRSSAAMSSPRMSSLMALRTSGRSRVRTATLSSVRS